MDETTQKNEPLFTSYRTEELYDGPSWAAISLLAGLDIIAMMLLLLLLS